jgi:hypothetical protein
MLRQALTTIRRQFTFVVEQARKTLREPRRLLVVPVGLTRLYWAKLFPMVTPLATEHALAACEQEAPYWTEEFWFRTGQELLHDDRSAAHWMAKDLQFYPHLRVNISGQFSLDTHLKIEPELVSRIKTAYRLAMEGFEGAGDSQWSIFAEHSRGIHECLLADDDAGITQILEDPIPTRLFYGFYSLAQDLNLDESSQESVELGGWSIRQILGCLIRLAEATGSIRAWNPENPPSDDGVTSATLETLLTALDEGIGIRLDFPNPFPREFGLPSSRGIASYRAPQAIYQAWRTRELLRESGGAKVLEIGAGMGRTAYYAQRLGIPDYVIVDLPLANVAQAVFLGRVLGSDSIWLPGDPISQMVGRIRIHPPRWLTASQEEFGVALNADSITEMDAHHAIGYFREISRRASLFLSINQESYSLRVRDLPSKCEIEPRVLRYPYWLRKGYVEEVYSFRPAIRHLPSIPNATGGSLASPGGFATEASALCIGRRSRGNSGHERDDDAPMQRMPRL